MSTALQEPSAATFDGFADRSPWGWRDAVAVVTLAGFIAGLAVNFFVITNDTFMTIYQFLMPASLAVLLLVGYGPLLAAHWRAFRARLWRNLLFVVIAVVALHVVLFLVRLPFGDLFVAGPLQSRAHTIEVDQAQGLVVIASLLAATGPMLIAFVEDTIFRHTLLARVPVWGRGPLLPTLLVILNSVAFGAVHIWAFGGSLLATVPYMVVGLVMNLIYLWKRNLWFVLGVHILFNSAALLGAALLLGFKIAGAI